MKTSHKSLSWKTEQSPEETVRRTGEPVRQEVSPAADLCLQAGLYLQAGLHPQSQVHPQANVNVLADVSQCLNWYFPEETSLSKAAKSSLSESTMEKVQSGRVKKQSSCQLLGQTAEVLGQLC